MSICKRVCAVLAQKNLSVKSQNNKTTSRLSVVLLMLIVSYSNPAWAQTVTFNYVGAPLSQGNPAPCPVIPNITATITGTLVPTGSGFSTLATVSSAQFNAGSFSFQFPSSGVLLGVILETNSTGNVGAAQLTLEASNMTGVEEGSSLFLNSNFGRDVFTISASGVFCGYQSFSPGIWTVGVAAQVAANNLGNGGDPATTPQTAPGAPPPANNSPCTAVASGLLVGNPINAATGNKFEAETDITCATHTGINLTRYYNSQDTSASPFGKGWHSTWHRGLKVNGTTVTVTRADGEQNIFTQSSTSANVYIADPDVTSVLAPILSSAGALNGWKLTLADDTVETYLVGGQLSSVTTRAGLTTTLSYDNTLTNVTRVTGRFGHVLSFTYDANGHVVQTTGPDGAVYAYTYDANNNLTSVTNPDGTKKQYLFENTSFVNALTGITDELGNRFATYAYDTQGRAISTQHAGGGELTTVTYNADGSSTVTDANGNQFTIGTTTQFGLMKASAVSGSPAPSLGGRAFIYDANGFIASKTDFDGNVTTYTHDARGNETSRTEASGTALARTTSVAWHPTFHLPVLITDPSGRTTAFTYDPHGNLLTKTITAGQQVRAFAFTYNAQGQVLTSTDPRGAVTRYTYDTKGDVASVTDPLGHVTNFTAYDGDGWLLRSVDPNGLVTTFAYDTRGRLTSQIAGTEKTTFTYDAAGNLVAVQKPDGSVINNFYDAAHRLTGERDALGNALAFALDGNDNRVQVGAYDPANNLVQHRSFAYDNVNRLAAELGAQNQETDYTYDPQGNLLSVNDPLNHKTSFAYDTLNRRTATTDPNSGVTKVGYDVLDRLTAEQDPKGLTTGYFYDGLDDQTGIASPDTGNTVKTYDAAGNVLTSTDARGFKTTYTYDALNRVTKAQYADGTASTYQYDQGPNGIGHLTRMFDPAGVTAFTYDQHGRLIEKAQQTGNITLITRNAYDNAGRLVSITYPSGKTVNLHYDAAGNVAALSLGNAWLISNATYRPFGPVQNWRQGNNQSFARAFDQDGRITQIMMGSAATVTYTYDAANRITGEIETGQPNQAFGYDALDRITAFANGTAQTSYGYDADGNRLTLATPAASLSEQYAYAANSNNLMNLVRKDIDNDHDDDLLFASLPLKGAPNRTPPVETKTFTFAYDATGNTLSDGKHAFTYDARGRLSSVMAAKDTDTHGFGIFNGEAHHATVYGINGLGERILKQAASRDDRDWDDFLRGFGVGAVEYVYDEAGHLIGEYDAHGRTIHETVYLGDLPVAVLDGTNTFGEFRTPTNVHYISSDNLGSPHIITDQANRKVWQWDHAPFGDTKPIEAAGFTYDLRFPGQVHDAESGLSNNFFRDYSPRLGRYAESDPAGLISGVNTYAYVGQNPVWAFDAIGLKWQFTQWNIQEWSKWYGIAHGWNTQAVCHDTCTNVVQDVEGPSFQDRPWVLNLPGVPTYDPLGSSPDIFDAFKNLIDATRKAEKFGTKVGAACLTNEEGQTLCDTLPQPAQQCSGSSP